MKNGKETKIRLLSILPAERRRTLGRFFPALRSLIHAARLTRSLSRRSLKARDILVVFCQDSQIRRLKRLFWGKPVTTDVVSFAYDDPPLIEIVINVNQAIRQALWGLKKELLFLYIHGLLHVLGHNDDTASKRKKMLGIGKKILDRCGKV